MRNSGLAVVRGAFEEVLWSREGQFSPAADVDGDGLVNVDDLLGLRQVLIDGGATGDVLATWQAVKLRRVDFNFDGLNDEGDWYALTGAFGSDDWLFDLNADGLVDVLDRDILRNDFGVIPEPVTLALLAAGGLALLRRRPNAR